MTMQLEPEIGVPMDDGVRTMDLTARARAATNTIEHLSRHGLHVEPNKEDEDVAARLAMAYAEDPEKTSKKVTHARAAKLTPPSLVLVDSILQNFGHNIAESAVQIRHLVTNKLIEETENPDPRVRIRALELLGKISDVGLFSEKTEITITHQTTDDIKERLRAKLTKLVNPEQEQNQDDIVDAVIVDDEEIDVDAEFGLVDEEDAENDAEEQDDGAENVAENDVDIEALADELGEEEAESEGEEAK